ncbi:MAG TPA: tRNA epoxyqueuosine(34) reductase QueG [Thermoanaerobaculia bacterium]|nr:tRNA epoxyqueuosine(34) reductase QueG [Thermoanaerobaculia bacterium]
MTILAGAPGTALPVDRSALAERVKQLAREAGFDRVGIAAATPSEQGEALHAWLARGDHAGMSWLARDPERRLRPADLLPGAVSIVAVALHYHPAPDGGEEPGGDLWPRVARYARGEDYHEVMGDGLRRLAAEIERLAPEARTRPYVDTGPLLEREVAARAGLGAVGKHTLLLHPEHGSWFLLGELLTDLDLAPDEPLADPCGSCTRCLAACPTGALAEPYRLDARRCISYWTIEHRGPVPAEARRGLGEWVFGCDLCQEACPWNREPPPATEPRLSLPPEREELDLGGLLKLGRTRYVDLFRRSPMKRAKLEGLQRNAALAAGNRADPAYLPALGTALRNPSPVVREAAAWALARIGGERAAALLAAAAEEEPDPRLRAALIAAPEANC